MRFELIDSVDSLMDFRIEILNFLLACSRQQEIIHLCLKSVIHFDINVIARSLLLFGALHTYHMVDDNGVWRMEQRIEALWNLRKLHTWTREDLLQILVTVYVFSLMCILQTIFGIILIK